MARFKRGQGSCSFNCCDEEGISPGSPYIQMRPADIPFSIQLLKMQEPCPRFQMVSLGKEFHISEAAHEMLFPCALVECCLCNHGAGNTGGADPGSSQWVDFPIYIIFV